MSNQTQAVTKKSAKELFSQVESAISEMASHGDIRFPENYSPSNALKGAWLKLQDLETRDKKKALEVCTPASINNALFEMVLKGLSVAKNQGYFIPYGNKLEFSVSYFGQIAMVKRIIDVVSISGNVIYEKDDFQFGIDPQTGRKKVIKHQTSFDSIGSTIKGAYAVIAEGNGTVHFEVMSMDQIRKAWNQGAANGNSPAHKNFEDQMAIKTVISRLCKMIINTSDDGNLAETNETKDRFDKMKESGELDPEKKVDVHFDEPEEVESESDEIDQSTGVVLEPQKKNWLQEGHEMENGKIKAPF